MRSKRKKILLSTVIISTVAMVATGSIYLLNGNYQKKSFDKYLSKEEYSYLPIEAKEYIKEIYKETGEVVLTEKNKQENTPYLNPQYIEYLEMSEDEKEKIDIIPDTYVLDYKTNESYSVNSDLPFKYDLRNLNGNNYLTPIKNQGNLGICWAISSIENAETYLMLKNNKPYNDNSQLFSARQLDYATSNNGMRSNNNYVWNNSNNGSRSLTSGGNFYASSIIMANGLSLVDESVLPWNESIYSLYPKEVLNYDYSKYEVNGTIQMPIINQDSASEDLINSFTRDVKNYIMQYGGPSVGTYSPDSTCGFVNTDGIPMIKSDDCANINASYGHAMQIIGWDDDYQYSYCDNGTKHYSVEDGNCSKGVLTEGKGTWILRNSWGDNSKYVYLTYDSTRTSIGFITSLSNMNNRTWNNNYHINPWINGKISNGLANTSSQSMEFDTHNNKSEKIQKIKILTSSKNGTYTLSITSGSNTYTNIAVASVKEVGIYTFDLSDKNIIITDSKFTVKIEGNNGATFTNDSISVFTKNVDNNLFMSTYSSMAFDETMPLSSTNPLYVSGSNYWNLDLNIYMKNFPSNPEISYRLKKNDTIYNSFAEVDNLVVIDNNLSTFSGSANITYSDGFKVTKVGYGNTLTFEILYNGNIMDSFPIKFSGNGKNSTSKVRLYANNGTNYFETYDKIDKQNATFNSNFYDNQPFFNNGYYIKSWNTKADGTGTSYDVNDGILIYRDIDLYAQWSNTLLNTRIYFRCIYSDKCNGYESPKNIEYNQKLTFPENQYSRDENYEFLYWKLDDNSFYEQESVDINSITSYPIFNNNQKDVYAVWSNDYKTIQFDANGGEGNMKGINVSTNVDSRLKKNLYNRRGYTFAGWNTLADGTGISYTDGQIINTNKDLTLYAIWQEGAPFEIKEYDYDDTKHYISTIMPYTVVDNYKKNIEVNKNYTIDVEYKTINNQQVIYTGSKTRIYNNQELIAEFTNIVIGDINGDGAVNSADLLKIRQHLLGTKEVTDIYYIASDINYDVSVNSADLLRIRQHLLGTKTISKKEN